jgi:hypothetical protein
MGLSSRALSERKRYGNANHQHERRPDAIIETQPLPRRVGEFVDDGIGYRIVAQALQPHHQRLAAHNPKHDEVPKGVERNQALSERTRGRNASSDRPRCCRGLYILFHALISGHGGNLLGLGFPTGRRSNEVYIPVNLELSFSRIVDGPRRRDIRNIVAAIGRTPRLTWRDSLDTRERRED